MKQLLTAFVVMLLLPVSAFAEDFDTSQHNLKLRIGEYEIESRQEINSNKDHIQVGRKIGDKANVQLRYVDTDDAEWRARVTLDVLKFGDFYAKQRVEFRHFQTAKDYWRVRPILGYNIYHTPTLKLFTEYQGSFNFGKDGEDNDFKLDSGQLKIGADYRINTFTTIGPFVQYEHDKDFNKDALFLGTTLKLEF